MFCLTGYLFHLDWLDFGYRFIQPIWKWKILSYHIFGTLQPTLRWSEKCRPSSNIPIYWNTSAIKSNHIQSQRKERQHEIIPNPNHHTYSLWSKYLLPELPSTWSASLGSHVSVDAVGISYARHPGAILPGCIFPGALVGHQNLVAIDGILNR